MSLADRLAAEFGDEKTKTEKKPRATKTNELDVFALANGVSTLEVLSWLGIATEDSTRGTMATCPGCGEDGALVCKDGGIKCLHDRCTHAGPRANPGFRTPIDLVAHVRQVEPLDAAKAICKQFQIEEPKAKPQNNAHHGEPMQPTADTPPAELELQHLGALLGPALALAERRRDGTELPVPAPFRELGEALGGGLWPGAHFLVSGTGVGKSQLTIQTALGAAKAGIPVLYVGLELDDAQIALRVVGEQIGLRWSNLYLGRCSPSEIERARATLPVLEGLPFHVDFGPPRGWPASRLYGAAEQLRKVHPSGPLYIVLDYLQLVGDETGPFSRKPELRERVGGAAYVARDVARRYGASIHVVSSAARTHYGLLASDAKEAGLVTQTPPGRSEPAKLILNPHVLIGLGKESGEVEFSADTVTTLIRWPTPLDNGETAIIAAVPKVRAGSPRWCALRFWARFEELSIKGLDELPQPLAKAGGRAEVKADDLEARLVTTLRSTGPLSRRKLVDQTEGTDGNLYRAVKSAIIAGKIIVADNGTLSAASAAAEEGGPHQ